MKREYKELLIIAIIVLFIVGLELSGVRKFITFEAFKQNREYLELMVKNNYFLSVLLFIVSYALVVISSMPIAGLWAIAGGFLFGVIPAVIYSNIGAIIGSTVIFLIIRYLLGIRFQKKYGHKLVNFNKNIEDYGASYLLITHIVSVIPFFIINTLAALTEIPLSTFIWTTSIGVIPGTFVYAYAGKELGSINSLGEIFSPKIFIAFGLLGLLGVISILFKRYKGIKTI